MKQSEIDQLPESIHIQGNVKHRSVLVNNTVLSPITSQKVRNHSPDGFSWGYGGSGPAQLALAILMHFMTDDQAQRFYQIFKISFVARWDMDNDFDVRISLRDFITMQHFDRKTSKFKYD